MPDGTSGLLAPATRAEFAALFSSMLGRGPLHARANPTFTDVNASHWAYGYMEEAASDHEAVRLQNGDEHWLPSLR